MFIILIMDILLSTIGIVGILKLMSLKKEKFEETYYDSESYSKTSLPYQSQVQLNKNASTLIPKGGWGLPGGGVFVQGESAYINETKQNKNFIKKNSLYLDKNIHGIPLKDYYEKYAEDVFNNGKWFLNKDLPRETKQYEDDSVVQQRMEQFTGLQQKRDRENIGKPHRTETPNLFRPDERNTGFGYQYGGQGPGFSLTRQKEIEDLKKTIKFKTNEQPFEKIQVGRGMSINTEVPASGGFHDFTRVLPANVSDYKSNQLPGMVTGGKWAYSNAPTSHKPVIKNRPNTFYTLSDHAPLPTKSVHTGGTLRPEYLLKNQNRQVINHGFGSSNLESFLCK